jgi:nucleoside-diphosphate-sugar epimerase
MQDEGMTRLLVVGGTGLLGQPTTERRRDDGFDVRVLVRDPRRAGERLGDSVEVVPGERSMSSAPKKDAARRHSAAASSPVGPTSPSSRRSTRTAG